MNKFQKVAAVAVMVGGMALSGGVAQACANGGSDDQPSGVTLDNLQDVECEQEFEAGLIAVPIQITLTGDNTQAIGNSCAVLNTDGN
ncbi:hypothetical protein [Streptomyces sp. NPDC052701]|uniref:hypothetical protein n=1 Tax=Streptomyces sp. NPDC052701 TaxID=3155533 RepID=UPI00342D69EE